MHLIHLEFAVILGIAVTQLFSISISSAPSECLASVDTCMSDLCKNEQAFYSDICDDQGCQIKGSELCNMTIQSVLDQFPSLRGCVCDWQEELCGSIQALATQCNRKPATQLKRSTMMDWQSSSLKGYVYDGAGSCLEQITVCVSDTVCNRYLAPVLQSCMGDQCNRVRCQQVTQQFYRSMPHNVAEMLVICKCEASDKSCLDMKTTLQSGMCGDETQICQEAVKQCLKDSNCRDLLKTFQDKCWISEEAKCSDSELQNIDCLTLMDPAFILGTDAECKKAFLATLGTALHRPCSCKGVHSNDLLTCNMIHDVLHNRSHFKTSWKSSSGPSVPPDNNKSDQSQSWATDYLMYAFATVLVVGVVILLPVAVFSKIWLNRRRDKTKFQPVHKSNCVVIL